MTLGVSSVLLVTAAAQLWLGHLPHNPMKDVAMNRLLNTSKNEACPLDRPFSSFGGQHVMLRRRCGLFGRE